jgi:hypothetical protein
MALAGNQTARGRVFSSTAAAVPRVSSIRKQLRAPKHSQLLRCMATIELPPDLQAELDELEKAQYCGNEGECTLATACGSTHAASRLDYVYYCYRACVGEASTRGHSQEWQEVPHTYLWLSSECWL